MKVLAVAIIAIALAGAIWLHSYTETVAASTPDDSFGSSLRRPFTGEHQEHPSWADPAAIFIAVAGVGVGGLLLVRQPT